VITLVCLIFVMSALMLLMFCFISFMVLIILLFILFFFNDTAATEIYTLSLHDALPICISLVYFDMKPESGGNGEPTVRESLAERSEEHTSELQSRFDLVCRLLLEKKKTHSQNYVFMPPKLRSFFIISSYYSYI